MPPRKLIPVLAIVYSLNLSQLDPSFATDNPQVKFGGVPVTLLGKPLQVGQPFPDVMLSDISLNMTPISSFKGKVTILSIVPSIDTTTCEKQTHILSEKNSGLDNYANLVTISRDLPFAQKRFTKKAKTDNLIYLSDYREGTFGEATGLLIDENRLLARAVVVLDKEGIIRYLEIVPELANLPKMKRAFQFARSLL